MVSTITDLGFDSIDIVEPHSAVTPRMLRYAGNVLNVADATPDLVKECVADLIKRGFKADEILYIFPDAGAEKRYRKNSFFKDKAWIGAGKNRNPKTGEITDHKFFADPEEIKKFKVAIIVDDICGRGATFLPLAKAMREVGIEEVYLVVAHCENNIHNGTILNGDLVNKVYTTDSVLSVPHDNLVIGISYRPNKRGRKLLAGIDLQNDFVFGTLGGAEKQAIIAYVLSKLIRATGNKKLCQILSKLPGEKAGAFEIAIVETLGENWRATHPDDTGYDIVWTRDTHESEKEYLESQEGKNLPVVHCIRGTWGWEIIEDIAMFIDSDSIIFDKGAFGSKDLVKYILDNDYVSVEFIGICTDICVINCACSIKTFSPETVLLVDPKACAGVTTESHNAAILVMNMSQIQTIEF
jgi:nicotinamidase-related amidase